MTPPAPQSVVNILLLTFLSTLLTTPVWACQTTPIDDIEDAAYHADYVYGDHGDIKVGDRVWGAPEYKVISVVTKTFTWMWVTQPLRVVVSAKWCWWGCTPTVVVSFMGTNGVVQLLNELWEHDRLPLTIQGRKVEVMTYYWKVLQELDIVNTVPMYYLYKLRRVKYLITGHSLGGALASLFAALVTEENEGIWSNPDTRLITFGSCRVGDEAFATLHDIIIPHHKKVRLVDNKDVVPHVPPQMMGFVHESRETWLEETSESEWYWGWCVKLFPFWCYTWRYKTVWRVCTLGDAEECSNSVYVDSVDDHMMSNYIAKIKAMANDRKKRRKFINDQCDSPKKLPKKYVVTNHSQVLTPEEHLLKLIAKQKWIRREQISLK